MNVHPKSLNDLTLAPVAIGIDTNLQRLRRLDVDGLFFELTLELNQSQLAHTRAGREQMIMDAATRLVDIHGWHVSLSADATAIELSDDPYSVSLALSPAISTFVTNGIHAESADRHAR